MMTTITRGQAHALAALVVARRPDWQAPGVIKALSDVRERGDLDQVIDAALRAARDPAAKTPAAIGFDQYWPVTPDRSGEPPRCPESGHQSYYAHNCGLCRFEHLRPTDPPPRTEVFPRPDFTRTPRPDHRSGAQSSQEDS